MSDLTAIEKMALEKLFGMSSGYVLDFTNRTFQEFIADSVNRDIFADLYDYDSGSKANRLRAFWKQEPNDVVGKLLLDLIAYLRHVSDERPEHRLLNTCSSIAERLQQGAAIPDPVPLLFISYARPDLQAAQAIVDFLTNAGLTTWLDKNDLKVGQDWEYEIRRQIAAASLVLICLSDHAVDRKGYFYQEMRYAVSEALKLPKGTVYVMPLRLNACQIPDDLRQWHALDLFTSGASQQLLQSVEHALQKRCVRANSITCEIFERTMREFTRR